MLGLSAAEKMPVPGIGNGSADSDNQEDAGFPGIYFASWKMIPSVYRVPLCTRLTPWRTLKR